MNNNNDILEFRIVSKPNGDKLVFVGQTDITKYIADLNVSIVSDPIDITAFASAFVVGKQSTLIRLELRDVKIVSTTTEAAQDISSSVIDINRIGKRRFSL